MSWLKKHYRLISPHFEWIAWVMGITLMAAMNPEIQQTSFCLFEWIGVSWCPGHGLGHSIAYLFRGEWALAFQAHPLGPPAVPLLLYRAVKSGYIAFNKYQLN